MTLISCSGLCRNCRHHKVLEKQRDRHPKTEAAAVEGTDFGLMVQLWLECRYGELVALEARLGGAESVHWFQNMIASWRPPVGVECEVPLGLLSDGRYIAVDEPEPHSYVARVSPHLGAHLLTAGRADLVWTRTCDPGGVYEGPVELEVCVGDLKRSAWRYGSPEQHPQLMALGLAAASYHAARFLRLGLYDARDAVWEWSDRIDVYKEGAAMLEEVRGMATMTDEPRPGEWCQGCYERTRCPEAQL